MRLLIFTGMTPDEPLAYVRAEDGRPVGGGTVADLETLAEAIDTVPDHVTVVLPGEPVVMRHISAPARSERQLLQAARFLLEDELAGPVDAMHVVLGSPAADGRRAIIAADQGWISGWLEALREAGLAPDVLTADTLCLGEDGTAIALVTPNRVALNLDGEGFAAERPLADGLAAALIAGRGVERLGIIRIAGTSPLDLPEDLDIHEAELPGLRALPAFFAGHLDGKDPVSFLQGAFERGIDWAPVIRPWRLAASLAAAGLAAWLLVTGVEGIALHQRAEATRTGAESRFSAAYPDLPRRNVAGQARQLAGAGGGDGAWFLDLSAVLARAMENRDGVQLAGLTYDPANQLVADIRFSDTGELDALKQALAEFGVAVEEGRNLSRDGTAYIGKLYLRSGA